MFTAALGNGKAGWTRLSEGGEFNGIWFVTLFFFNYQKG